LVVIVEGIVSCMCFWLLRYLSSSSLFRFRCADFSCAF